jgi:hypothetical protein
VVWQRHARVQWNVKAITEPYLASCLPSILHFFLPVRKPQAEAAKAAGCMGPGAAAIAAAVPAVAPVAEAFRRLVAGLGPLLGSPTLPPQHIANFVEYQVSCGCMMGGGQDVAQ